MKKLDGQIVIVTGGARGIGKGICKLFCDEGAIVFLWDILEVGIARWQSPRCGHSLIERRMKQTRSSSPSIYPSNESIQIVADRIEAGKFRQKLYSQFVSFVFSLTDQ